MNYEPKVGDAMKRKREQSPLGSAASLREELSPLIFAFYPLLHGMSIPLATRQQPRTS